MNNRNNKDALNHEKSITPHHSKTILSNELPKYPVEGNLITMSALASQYLEEYKNAPKPQEFAADFINKHKNFIISNVKFGKEFFANKNVKKQLTSIQNTFTRMLPTISMLKFLEIYLDDEEYQKALKNGLNRLNIKKTDLQNEQKVLKSKEFIIEFLKNNKILIIKNVKLGNEFFNKNTEEKQINKLKKMFSTILHRRNEIIKQSIWEMKGEKNPTLKKSRAKNLTYKDIKEASLSFISESQTTVMTDKEKNVPGNTKVNEFSITLDQSTITVDQSLLTEIYEYSEVINPALNHNHSEECHNHHFFGAPEKINSGNTTQMTNENNTKKRKR